MAPGVCRRRCAPSGETFRAPPAPRTGPRRPSSSCARGARRRRSPCAPTARSCRRATACACASAGGRGRRWRRSRGGAAPRPRRGGSIHSDTRRPARAGVARPPIVSARAGREAAQLLEDAGRALRARPQLDARRRAARQRHPRRAHLDVAARASTRRSRGSCGRRASSGAGRCRATGRCRPCGSGRRASTTLRAGSSTTKRGIARLVAVRRRGPVLGEQPMSAMPSPIARQLAGAFERDLRRPGVIVAPSRCTLRRSPEPRAETAAATMSTAKRSACRAGPHPQPVDELRRRRQPHAGRRHGHRERRVRRLPARPRSRAAVTASATPSPGEQGDVSYG